MLFKNKNTDENILWNFIKSIISFKSRNVTLALILMLSIGLTEGISLLLLIPLLQLVGLDVQQGSLTGITVYIDNFFSYFGIQPTLITVLLLYVVIVSLNAYLLKLETNKSAQVQYEYAADLRKRLFTAITHVDWLYFISKKSADFAHALTYEIERIVGGINQFLYFITSIIILAVYIIFALRVTGIITGIILIVGIIFILLLRNKALTAHTSGEELSQSSKELYLATVKQVDGMKTIKSFNVQDKNISLFQNIADDVAQKYQDTIASYADVKFLFDVGTVVVLSVIVFFLIEFMKIPTAELLILLYLFVRMFPSFNTIQRGYQYILNVLPAYQTVIELEEECLGHAEKQVSHGEMEFNHKIIFEDVSFSYPGKNDKVTLENINLNIEKGKTTALIGESGAGKSTIVDLVMGLIKPDQGQILIDETPLNDENISLWRDKIGYVPQETYLFNDTIRNNLLVSYPEADEEEILEALKLASADEFVKELPSGIDTLIGERGVLLSGGERQRIALARALLRKPSLLILDEATSNLDTTNEKRILKSIAKLHGELTILMVAHRLSTISDADYIYLIEDGKIIEEDKKNY